MLARTIFSVLALVATTFAYCQNEGGNRVDDCCYQSFGRMNKNGGSGDLCGDATKLTCDASCCAPSSGWGINDRLLPVPGAKAGPKAPTR
ncbi:unnamed protein product [Diplocarpon coronariae]|uniref:Peptidoglycan glycosyltransferase n=1 Tax=Diplocarpon coronariae TaxID=2795749 RepID=A0A218ZHS6_9HELO|nr:hypothetical protein JHW43_002292 [Diplocarpon mali]OWP07314.1 peptidoglycan glycosyltransferase [Marssonina coronariae]